MRDGRVERLHHVNALSLFLKLEILSHIAQEHQQTLLIRVVKGLLFDKVVPCALLFLVEQPTEAVRPVYLRFNAFVLPIGLLFILLSFLCALKR